MKLKLRVERGRKLKERREGKSECVKTRTKEEGRKD